MANKKINQLVAKTTIQSTDLFPIGDATTGTLYKKTIADLQAAIGGAVISVNGLVGTVVLDADDILETGTPTNRYFTEARARASISLTTSGSSGASTYSSSTGVLNVPTYTLAGLGGITATFLSGGTGITYNSGTGVISYSGTVYTDTSIKALLSATAPLSFNSTTGAFSISQATTSTNGYLSSTDWNTFNGKQNAVTLTTTGTSGAATFSGGTLNIPQYQAALTNPVTGTGTSGYVTFWNGGGTITGDSAHFWDNTNKRLGIGNSSPAYTLDVSGDTRFLVGAGATRNVYFGTSATNYGKITYNDTTGELSLGTTQSYSTVFLTNNTEKMRILANGNVGIGTTSPGYLLHVNGNMFSYNYYAQQSAWTIGTTDSSAAITGFGSTGYLGTTNVLAFYTNTSERMRILSSGEVCINTTSTINSDRLMVQMANNTNQTGLGVRAINDGGTASQPAISFYNGSGILLSRMYADNGTGYFAINTTSSNTERLRIVNSSGNILLGTSTDNGERLYVSGAIRATGTITANSDISLKKNLAKIENALEKVEQINGYTYEFKEDDSKRHAGVIAQEIQGVLPEIVNKGNDGLLGVEYGNISALLIEAIKDLKSQNESLVARLEALEK